MSIFPKWFSEFKFSDIWSGVKADVVAAVPHIGTGVKSILKGATSVLTPSIIWVAVIAIIGLIIFKQYKKVLGL